MITTIVFDADGTLVNLRPAVRAAQQAVLAELHEMTPAAADLTVADLDADWEAEFERRRSQPVELIRRAALSRSLARVGLQAELDRVADLFFARRFAATRLFDGVPELLAELRNSYVLGFATNGNSHAGRVGLAGEFAFEVCAHVDGVPKKPAAGFFEAVIDAAGASPGSIVHVGDYWDHDIAGAAAAGLRTIWLNRAGADRPPLAPDSLPDAEISSLGELVRGLRAAAGGHRPHSSGATGASDGSETPVLPELG